MTRSYISLGIIYCTFIVKLAPSNESGIPGIPGSSFFFFSYFLLFFFFWQTCDLLSSERPFGSGWLVIYFCQAWMEVTNGDKPDRCPKCLGLQHLALLQTQQHNADSSK